MDTRLLSKLGTLRQLEIFLKVAELGSIIRAAEALYLSHSAVSIQIRKLAEALGLPLYEVIGKKIYLTEAGAEVAKTGQELFTVIQNLDHRLNNLKGLTAGTLRISVVSTAKYFLPRVIGAFCREYPQIDVDFKVGNRAQVLERLSNNLDDLYILSDPGDTPDITSTPFLPNPLVVIASSNNPLSRKKHLKWEDLAGEKFLMREQGSGTHSAIQSHLKRNNFSIRKQMVIESNEAIKFSVIENMGITILSAYAVAEGLTQLPVETFPINSTWHVVHLKEKRLSLIAEKFLDFIVNQSKTILPMDKIEAQLRRARGEQ